MYLLDTNVVSELRRPEKDDPRVMAWAESVLPSFRYISVMTLLELELGALSMRRRDIIQGVCSGPGYATLCFRGSPAALWHLTARQACGARPCMSRTAGPTGMPSSRQRRWTVISRS